MTQQTTTDLQALLAEVFEFSTVDIEANRAGEFSAAQRERMTAKHHANSRFAWVAFAIIFGLALPGFSAEMNRTGKLGVNTMMAFLGLTTFFGVIVWGGIRYYRHQLRRTLREGTVHSARGNIRIVGERGEKLTHWFFCVGNQRFPIERSDHRIRLQQSGVAGRSATVYYAAPWRGLLCVVLDA